MDGLLMYAGRRPGGGNTEFMLLEVFSGQARFTADLGSGIYGKGAIYPVLFLCKFVYFLFLGFFYFKLIDNTNFG